MHPRHSPAHPERSPSAAAWPRRPRATPSVAGPLFALALATIAAAPARADATPIVITTTTTIDLNSASAEALATLPGIGPRRARAIVERRAKRRFRTVEELRAVRGFGPKLVRRLRPHVVARP